MSALTRWVLAHKRIVVVLWLALAVAGAIAAGPASRALDPEFSVPDKEGWETNVAIAAALRRHRRRQRAAAAGRHAARGQTVESPGVRGDLRRLDATPAAGAAAARASPPTPRPATARSSRRTAARRSRSSIRGPTPTRAFGDNPRGRSAPRRALAGRPSAGAPVHLTGFDALARGERRRRRARASCSRRCSAARGALLVLAFVFASFLAFVPLVMAIVVDPDHVPAAARPDRRSPPSRRSCSS